MYKKKKELKIYHDHTKRSRKGKGVTLFSSLVYDPFVIE
jgi:hypothetical protein